MHIQALALSALVFASAGWAQTPQHHEFEVASVRPIAPGALSPGHGKTRELGCANGRFISWNISPHYLILWAWDMVGQDFRLAGVPGWAATDKDDGYAIRARAGSPVSEDECRLMVRTLLADRFKLEMHTEKRTIDAWALVVAKDEPKIRRVRDTDPTVNGPGFIIDGGPVQMLDRSLRGWSMEQLAQALGGLHLGRPIVDRTGLEGIYRIRLSFHMRETAGDGPDVTTALKEQLGLELVSRKEPTEVFVVDRLVRPGPN